MNDITLYNNTIIMMIITISDISITTPALIFIIKSHSYDHHH